MSGSASLRALNAMQTGPFASQALVPSASFLSGMPNRISERTPAFQAVRASSTRLSTESCATPGIEAMGLRTPFPETANSGSMKSPGRSRVSRTRPRSVSVLRRRRGRSAGKAMMPHRNPRALPLQGFQRIPSVIACSRSSRSSALSAGPVGSRTLELVNEECQRVKS